MDLFGTKGHAWQVKFEELEAWAKHGHSDVPNKDPNLVLGLCQRNEYRQGKLSQERIEMLEDSLVGTGFIPDYEQEIIALLHFVET